MKIHDYKNDRGKMISKEEKKKNKRCFEHNSFSWWSDARSYAVEHHPRLTTNGLLKQSALSIYKIKQTAFSSYVKQGTSDCQSLI